MEIPNCFYRVSVKALVLDETRTKFLIVQEDNGKWELPGGGLDWGESPAEGMRREITEEMGLDVTYVAPQPSYFLTKQSPHKSCWIVNVLYEVVLSSLDFVPSKECVSVLFVTKEEALSTYSGTNIALLGEMFVLQNHVI